MTSKALDKRKVEAYPSVGNVAELLGIDGKTVFLFIEKGVFPYRSDMNGRRMFLPHGEKGSTMPDNQIRPETVHCYYSDPCAFALSCPHGVPHPYDREGCQPLRCHRYDICRYSFCVPVKPVKGE